MRPKPPIGRFYQNDLKHLVKKRMFFPKNTKIIEVTISQNLRIAQKKHSCKNERQVNSNLPYKFGHL